MLKNNKQNKLLLGPRAKKRSSRSKNNFSQKKQDQSESAAYKLITKPVSNLHFVNSKKMTNFKKSD